MQLALPLEPSGNPATLLFDLMMSAAGYKRGLSHSHNQCLKPKMGVKMKLLLFLTAAASLGDQSAATSLDEQAAAAPLGEQTTTTSSGDQTAGGAHCTCTLCTAHNLIFVHLY